MKHNILQFIDYAAPYRGNFIDSLRYLNKYDSHRNTIFLLPASARNLAWVDEFLSRENEIYFVDRSFFSNSVSLSKVFYLNRICRDHDITIIHTHFIHHNLNLFILSRFRRIRILCHLHNHYIFSGYKGYIKSRILKHTSDLFIGVSHSVALEASKVLRTQRVIEIRNAIDFTRLQTEKKSIEPTGDYLQVLMFGWPYYRKGVDVAIRAVLSLIGEGFNLTLSIVLAGGDEVVKKEIEKDFLEVPPFVKFLPPVEDIGSYFNRHHIMVSASREEGFNYTLVEGAYCNCMLVSSDIDGVPVDIPKIEPFKSGDPDSLVSAIKKLMEMDAFERQKIKEEQRRYVTSTFSLEKWAGQIQDCYKDMQL